MRVPSEQGARLCQLLLCGGAAQQDTCPRTDSSGIPARKASAEGSRRMGLARGLQPTSEQLKVPYEPTPAHHLGLGEQQHGGKGTKQSLLLQVSLAHWSWTLALFAFRDRCVPC